MSRINRAMSPASLAISILALVVATSMTSASAASSLTTQRLAPSSVSAAAVKNGAVTTKKLKNGAVTTKKLAKGAVGTKKLKNGAVGTKKLKNGAVGAKKLKNGAVTNAKIAPGTITVDRLSLAAQDALRGARGPAGPQGPQGEPGAPGAPGFSGFEMVQESVGSLPGGSARSFSVQCPAGKFAIGGGWNIPPSVMQDGFTVSQSRPSATVAGDWEWRIHVLSHQTSDMNVTMFAVCAEDPS